MEEKAGALREANCQLPWFSSDGKRHKRKISNWTFLTQKTVLVKIVKLLSHFMDGETEVWKQ